MFDIGFSELMVIAIVALVVIGPERLPKVARTAGHLLGRLQRYVQNVKSDINREMQLEELKKMHSDIQDSARSFERSISSGIQEVEQTFEHTVQSTEDAVKELSAEAQAIPSGVAAVAPPVEPVAVTDPVALTVPASTPPKV
jgi:sec-independent protein translocase protein TatB